MSDFKYNEDKFLDELKEYIGKTYAGHYSGGKNKTQALDLIIDSGHGLGFVLGNCLKYSQRCKKKGKPEDWKLDLMKVVHYAILAMYILEEEQKEQK